MRTIPLISALLLSVCTGSVAAQDTPMQRTAAPEGASAYIQSPAAGAQISSPVTVRFGLRGIGVAPAGVQLPNTGHHHLLIDVGAAEMPSFDLPLPATDQVVHFGLGHTETQIELAPGQHTLQLVLGDHLHRPHSPPVTSETITITVTE